MDLRIAGTVSDSIVDGPGLRFVIFTQGCSHHCKGCHNPHTWPYDGGTVADLDELYDKVVKNPILSGVTLSGGEPFDQALALYPLVKRYKDSGIEIAAYSGYTFEELIRDEDKLKLLSLCDVLIDGEFLEAEKSLDLKFRGSKNQRILDVKASLDAAQAVNSTDKRWIG